jgi:hypothetical protein
MGSVEQVDSVGAADYREMGGWFDSPPFDGPGR